MLTQNYKTLTPAYGRDYESKAEVIADWEANKDFTMEPEGCKINKEQVADGVAVNIRYKKLRSIAVIKNVARKAKV